MSTTKRSYEFGPYRVDVANRLLLRHDEPLPVTPKAVDTLIALIDHSREILSKDDLMKIVWPDSVVEDGNLTQNIYLLRKTLNEPNGHNYIQTLARRGYRFVGEVRELQTDNGHLIANSISPTQETIAPVPKTEAARTIAASELANVPGPGTRSRFLVMLLTGLVLIAFLAVLLIKFSDKRRSNAAAAPVVTSEAQLAYSKGRQFWSKQTTPALEQSIQYFQQSIRRDANYAPAFAGLADAYTALSERYDMDQHQSDALAKAKEAATRAVQLNDRLAEGHAALAVVKQQSDWDWTGAEAELKRAIELDPNYAYAHQRYAFLLAALGRRDEAKAEITRARELDPRSILINQDLGVILCFAGDYQQAIEQFRSALEIDPSDPLAVSVHRWLGLTYEQRGMHEQAAAEFIEGLRLQNGSPERISALRQAYDAAGMKGYWRKWLEFREQRIKLGGINPFAIAQVYALLGEKDKAFEQLNKACDDHSLPVAALRFGPTFDDLRSDPRYSTILKRVKVSL